MRVLMVTIMLLATSVAGAQIKNFRYMEHHTGVGHARCYLVGFDTDVDQWYGVCEVVDELASDSKGERHHKDIVYWDSTGAEKSSKKCDKDCPDRPDGSYTVFTPAGGGSIPLYMVFTDSSTGVIGGNSVFGQAMLLFP